MIDTSEFPSAADALRHVLRALGVDLNEAVVAHVSPPISGDITNVHVEWIIPPGIQTATTFDYLGRKMLMKIYEYDEKPNG